MENQVKVLLEDAKKKIEKADNIRETEDIRIEFLGKKGSITAILKGMKDLSPEEKKNLGMVVNKAREEIETQLKDKFSYLKKVELEKKLEAEKIDVTEPAKRNVVGSKHPITRVIDEITEVFMSMGFSIAEGPEVETVVNNFDSLNAGPHHPARDPSDTFYITDDILLRTQTSPVQIRTLKAEKPPIKIISPGRCFRCDTPDATHSPMFHQVEGLLIDEGITMADLKGTLDTFAKRMFGENVKTKFRPHHFPFTEPSAEMDMSCFKCGGSGCNVCKHSGWIEILGCGMVHPNVLRVGEINTEEYTGFAFGMGVERIAMLKYGVEDIRYFYENDMRFINQFK